jgi:predicted enzyme related to lactoylglutathione lyase
MPIQPQAGAVIYAKDIAPMGQFYEQVAGFTITHTEVDYTVLESPGLQLVIVAIPGHIAASIDIETPPVRREDTPIKLVLPVPSLSHARSEAPRYGGALNDAEREWLFQGNRVCDGHDPEGNVLQFCENVS